MEDSTLPDKLRQAVWWMSRLSREKQQLIELGNCLRAQLTKTGLEGKWKNKLSFLLVSSWAKRKLKRFITNFKKLKISSYLQERYFLCCCNNNNDGGVPAMWIYFFIVNSFFIVISRLP